MRTGSINNANRIDNYTNHSYNEIKYRETRLSDIKMESELMAVKDEYIGYHGFHLFSRVIESSRWPRWGVIP